MSILDQASVVSASTKAQNISKGGLEKGNMQKSNINKAASFKIESIPTTDGGIRKVFGHILEGAEPFDKSKVGVDTLFWFLQKGNKDTLVATTKFGHHLTFTGTSVAMTTDSKFTRMFKNSTVNMSNASNQKVYDPAFLLKVAVNELLFKYAKDAGFVGKINPAKLSNSDEVALDMFFKSVVPKIKNVSGDKPAFVKIEYELKDKSKFVLEEYGGKLNAVHTSANDIHSTSCGYFPVGVADYYKWVVLYIGCKFGISAMQTDYVNIGKAVYEKAIRANAR